MALYVGQAKDGNRYLVESQSDPTEADFGDRYEYFIGPFKTWRGANFMRKYGVANPHCQTVDDAEKLARRAKGGE